jgi:Ni/Fe-hydrogenase 1 B-type cytochrome subunit
MATAIPPEPATTPPASATTTAPAVGTPAPQVIQVDRRTRADGLRPARHAIYVWQLPIRIIHWTIVISLVVLSFTGYYLYHPFFASGSAGHPGFALGDVRSVHELFGFIFTAAFLGRVYWAFAGNRYAHWRALIPLRRPQLHDLADMLRFYTLLRRSPPRANGHNPLAALAYLALYGLFALSILSGLGLFAFASRIPIWQTLFGWTYTLLPFAQLKLLHFLLMFVFAAFMIFHVYCSILVDVEERNGELSSIFTGYKSDMLEGELPRDDPRHHHRDPQLEP